MLPLILLALALPVLAAPVADLEERLLPITATTTVVVQMTRTATVWVRPTDQVIWVPSSINSMQSSVTISELSVTSASVSSTVAQESSADIPTQVLPGDVSLTASDSASETLLPWTSAASSPPLSSFTNVSTATPPLITSDASRTADSVSTSTSGWSSFPASVTSSSAAVTLAAGSVTSVASSTSLSSAQKTTLWTWTTAVPSATPSPLLPVPRTLMNAYYPDWAAWHLTPEAIDWSKFDVIDFAFALPTADFGLQFTQWDSSDLLTRLVETGHAAGKRVKLSIGGWTGSAYCSTICASPDNRKTFIDNIMVVVNAYNLDGIDIDWEYPGTTRAGNNAVSRDDSANFLLFLRELRSALPPGALISTATQVWPFADFNGHPMSDVSAFAEVIDWILIMNYDIWGSSSTPGPNAPLSDACHNSTQPLANAYAAISSWTTAGMPLSKITLGVPAYGYLQKSSSTALKQRRADYVTTHNDNGGTADGQIQFASLISQGSLTPDGLLGAGGFTREWDSCSSTVSYSQEYTNA